MVYSEFQSGCRVHHITETKITNDVLMTSNNELFLVPVLPDISASLDTTDQGFITDTRIIGFKGYVQCWFGSYSDRFHFLMLVMSFPHLRKLGMGFHRALCLDQLFLWCIFI